MASRSGNVGCAIAVILLGLVLLFFKSCFDQDRQRTEERDRKRREYEEQKKRPSSYRNPDIVNRRKTQHNQSYSLWMGDGVWFVLLTPRTRTIKELMKGGEDDGWVHISDKKDKFRSLYVKPNEYIDIEAKHKEAKFFFRTLTSLSRSESVYMEGSGQIYLWADCPPGKYCVGVNEITGAQIKLSEDSSVALTEVWITVKSLPNFN